MNRGCWIVDPKTGKKVAGVRGADGKARPVSTKPSAKETAKNN